MTPRMNSNTADEAVELLMNAAMVIERSAYLGVGHYERHGDRVSYANGFKPKEKRALTPFFWFSSHDRREIGLAKGLIMV